jgi:uncharacterized damage-inducible protein DinB
MKEQLLETWRIHNKMNFLLMDNITDAGMERTSGPRGRTVYHQLSHIHNVRLQWLEVCAPDIFKNHLAIKKETGFDRNGLRKALEESAAGIEELIHKSCNNEGRVKNFKKGIIPLTGYFISHESHHRGNILLTLKLAGENLPDAIKWGLWEWGK